MTSVGMAKNHYVETHRGTSEGRKEAGGSKELILK